MLTTPERSLLPAILSITLLLIPLLALPGAPPATAEVVNRIVLRVNDRIVTLQDYQMRRSQMLADLSQADLSPSERERTREQIGERVFRDLYEETLLLSRADQMDIRVPEEHLDRVLEQIRERMGVPDQESFEIALAQSGMSLEDFRERWRANLRMREVTARELQAEIAEQLRPEHLRRIYRENPERFEQPERVRLQEVVVLEEGTEGEAQRRRLAGEIRDRVQGGEELADVAAGTSESGATSTVIDLGWVEPGELAPALEEAAFALEAGEISEPIPARGGLHLVEVLEREEASVKPFAEVAEQIRRAEQDRLFTERYGEYMDDLEERSFIRVDPPPGASGFRAVEGSVVGDVREGDAPAATNEPLEGEAGATPEGSEPDAPGVAGEEGEAPPALELPAEPTEEPTGGGAGESGGSV